MDSVISLPEDDLSYETWAKDLVARSASRDAATRTAIDRSVAAIERSRDLLIKVQSQNAGRRGIARWRPS